MPQSNKLTPQLTTQPGNTGVSVFASNAPDAPAEDLWASEEVAPFEMQNTSEVRANQRDLAAVTERLDKLVAKQQHGTQEV